MFPRCSLLITLRLSQFFSNPCLLYMQMPYGNCEVHSRTCVDVLADIRASIRQYSFVAQSRRRCVSLHRVVGRLSADKSMSHSLCLVRPNMPEADHCLPAYQLKQIALSMLYYLFGCWVLFQTSHWEVVLISQRLMTGASTSFACFHLRMSNDHHHEFMGSAANEWSVIHCHSVFAMLLLPFQSNTLFTIGT